MGASNVDWARSAWTHELDMGGIEGNVMALYIPEYPDAKGVDKKGVIHLFARGKGNSLIHMVCSAKFTSTSANCSGANIPVTGVKENPFPIYANGKLYVFFQGTSGDLLSYVVTNEPLKSYPNFSGPYAVPGNTAIWFSPFAVFDETTKNLHVFARDNNMFRGFLLHAWLDTNYSSSVVWKNEKITLDLGHQTLSLGSSPFVYQNVKYKNNYEVFGKGHGVDEMASWALVPSNAPEWSTTPEPPNKAGSLKLWSTSPNINNYIDHKKEYGNYYIRSDHTMLALPGDENGNYFFVRANYAFSPPQTMLSFGDGSRNANGKIVTDHFSSVMSKVGISGASDPNGNQHIVAAFENQRDRSRLGWGLFFRTKGGVFDYSSSLLPHIGTYERDDASQAPSVIYIPF